ncbi:MAG: aryl-sulfate sulfotransferase [Planctomycetota bacterium]|nr:MAG: aryl-sulfate sulfotransferase [Planctomycetota bacterium]
MNRKSRVWLLGSLAILIVCLVVDGCAITEVGPGEIYVDIYDSTKACNGTTIFADLSNQTRPRIIEVDMQGTIVWEYLVPQDLKQYTNPGFDVEVLANNNVLFVLPGKGIYQIDRAGKVVWSHMDTKVSHDADRLVNGNPIYVYGKNDTVNDAQVKEINAQGGLVWSWYAKDHYYVEPYIAIENQGWAHTNAVTRMSNGNTLISPRNFSLTVEVDTAGQVVWSIDWTTLYGGTFPVGYDPHEPEIHSNDHLLVCLQHDTPYQVVEIDRATNQPVWEYYREGLRTSRDCDRLPNGNTLIVGVLEPAQDSVIFEVTPEKEIVWQLKVKDVPATKRPGWFYKAQRICQQ